MENISPPQPNKVNSKLSIISRHNGLSELSDCLFIIFVAAPGCQYWSLPGCRDSVMTLVITQTGLGPTQVTTGQWALMRGGLDAGKDLDSAGHWVLGRGSCALLAGPPVDYSPKLWDRICRIKCVAL